LGTIGHDDRLLLVDTLDQRPEQVDTLFAALRESGCVQGFGRRPIEDVRRGAGAVVGKPSEKEPAGGGWRRCGARYGDFGAVPTDVAAADVAGGVIARRRGAGDAAWNARQRKLDADLGFAGLAG
jgi:hypothetical protein